MSRSCAAFSKSCAVTASDFSRCSAAIFSSSAFRSGEEASAVMRTWDAASSIRSMALSGRNRSPIYRLDSCTAASSASSVMVSLWCASYLSRRPFRISSVASGVGSPTVTGWNRRSSAASFSIYLRYSLRVVAPMTRISPRPSAGLIMLAASTAPSAEPAPTMVCSSSMNRITLPAFFTSARVFLIRSSNSPRYLVPATMPLRSRDRSFLSSSSSGTSPEAMRSASPSAMAVLPTPGSPIRTGLFLVRRDRIWMTRWISLSRPITGSSLPERAASVRSRVNSASVLFFLSPSRLAAAAPPAAA